MQRWKSKKNLDTNTDRVQSMIAGLIEYVT